MIFFVQFLLVVFAFTTCFVCLPRQSGPSIFVQFLWQLLRVHMLRSHNPPPLQPQAQGYCHNPFQVQMCVCNWLGCTWVYLRVCEQRPQRPETEMEKLNKNRKKKTKKQQRNGNKNKGQTGMSGWLWASLSLGFILHLTNTLVPGWCLAPGSHLPGTLPNSGLKSGWNS